MNLDFTPTCWTGKLLAASVLVFSLGGCATARNPALERARAAYEQALNEPGVAARAAVALDEALLTLERAERVWEKEKDVAEVDHLAYLTEKRAEIARVTAQRRLAADQIRQIRSGLK